MKEFQKELKQVNAKLPAGYHLLVSFSSNHSKIMLSLIQHGNTQKSMSSTYDTLYEDFDHLVEYAVKAENKLAEIRKTAPVFTHTIAVSGNYNTNFHFTSENAAREWIKSKFPELNAKYGNTLRASTSRLPGLKVGDTCKVHGEGNDIFKIVDIVKYAEDYYGFIIDSGCAESVHKCYNA